MDGQAPGVYDLPVGTELGVSETYVTSAMIRSWCAAVEDLDPAYLEPDPATGKTVAPPSVHAAYTHMKMAVGSARWVPRGAVHTRQGFEFKGEIREGDYIYTTVSLKDKYERKGRRYIVYGTVVKNQRGEVVCVGEMTNLLM